MIVGIGIDLVSVNRIGRVYDKYPDRFISRIFTVKEKNSFIQKGKPIKNLASRFAAKEAVLKSIGCGIGPAALNEVEVIIQPSGQPLIKLHGKASHQAKERNINSIMISMTHEPPFACACAVAFILPGECN